MSAAAKSRLTPQQYLAMERRSGTKHEYLDGEVFAMAGASREHNLIAMNLGREISQRLLERPCEAYGSDMRVLVRATGLYTYPDLSAVCGEPQIDRSEGDTLLNPQLIVEVLSPSTEAYDRGGKFAHYMQLPSLREYVLVAQDRARVERFVRQGDSWVLTVFSDDDAVLRLDSVGCEIPLRGVYAKVPLPARPGRP